MRFTADMVIVITGSSRGLGLEFVKHFLEYTDSKVVATARSLSKAENLCTLMTQYPKRLQTITLDTSEESSIEVTHAGQSVRRDDCNAVEALHTVSWFCNRLNNFVQGVYLEHLIKASASEQPVTLRQICRRL